MKGQLKMLDDLAQVAGGAVGLLNQLQKQIRNDIQERIDEKLTDMDFVARADFDRVEASLKEARLRQDALEKRLAELEKNKGSSK